MNIFQRALVALTALGSIGVPAPMAIGAVTATVVVASAAADQPAPVDALGSCTTIVATYNVSGRCDSSGGSLFVYAYTECWTWSGYHPIWDHTAASVGEVTTVHCSTGVKQNSKLIQTNDPTP